VSAPDHRDLALADFAAAEAAVVDLAATWREIAHAAIHALAERDRHLAAQDRAIAALRDELRRYTGGQVTGRRAA
jgi:hypothetical protein